MCAQIIQDLEKSRKKEHKNKKNELKKFNFQHKTVPLQPSHEVLTSHGFEWRRFPGHGKMWEIPSME